MVTASRRKVLRHQVYSALIILLCCFLLFYIDEGTKKVSDLFKPGNIFALILYFIPTYLICLLFYRLLQKKDIDERLVLSLSIGIPTGFVIVISVLSYTMGRFH